MSGLASEYQNAVDQYNKAFLENQPVDPNDPDSMSWSQWINYLKQRFAGAVDTINEFNDITNQGYADFVGDRIKSHQKIFGFATPIVTLETTVQNEVDKLSKTTPNPTVIDTQWLKEHAFDRTDGIMGATTILDGINSEVSSVKTFANTLAQEYYDKLHGDCLDVIGQADDAMKNAGISDALREAALKSESGKLNQAETRYTLATTVNTDEYGKLSVHMSAIADILDQISTKNIDMKGAAATQWTNDFSQAKATLDGYKKLLEDTEAEGYYAFLLPDEREESKDALQKVIDAADELNRTATDPENDILTNLSDWRATLQEYLATAEGINSSATDKNTSNFDEKKAYEEFQKAINGDEEDSLKTAFDALKSWDNGMAVEYLQNYSNIDDAIVEVKEEVDKNKGRLTDPRVESAIEDLINTARKAIDDGYIKCYDDEKAALGKLRDRANVDWNNAFKEAVDASGVPADLRAELDQLGSDYEALLAKTFDSSDKENIGTELLRIQNGLCDIISRIAAEAEKENPATSVLQDVTASYNAVAEQLEDLQNYLDGKFDEVKKEYADKVAEQAEDLATIHAGIEGAGDNILATGEGYKTALNVISGALTDLKSAIDEMQQEVQAEKDRQAASDARAAELQAQLDGLSAGVDAFKAFVEGSEIYKVAGENEEFKTTYEGLVAELEGELANMQEWLTAQKEAYGLTAESILNGAEAFSASLTNYTDIFATAESDYLLSRTADKYTEVAAVINGTVHNNQAELEEELASIDNRIKELTPSVTIEGVNELRTSIDQIVADLEALKANAEANEFVAGDLDGNGEVDASDLNALLSLIASGNAEPEQVKACDLNGNGELEIGDVILLVDLILGKNDPAEALAKKYANYQAPASMTALIGGVETANENGVRTIAIELQNSGEFFGGEFGIKLPAGMQILSEGFGDRVGDVAVATADLSDGTHRVAFISTDEKAIEGSEGALYIIEVTGSGNVTIDSPIFTDRYGNLCYGSDPNTTGIGSIYDNLKNGASRVYDAAGRLMNKMQRGINIIVNGKGKGSKVLKK